MPSKKMTAKEWNREMTRIQKEILLAFRNHEEKEVAKLQKELDDLIKRCPFY